MTFWHSAVKPGATLSLVSAINPKLFEKTLLNATHKLTVHYDKYDIFFSMQVYSTLPSLQNIVATHTFNLASLWYVIQFTSHWPISKILYCWQSVFNYTSWNTGWHLLHCYLMEVNYTLWYSHMLYLDNKLEQWAKVYMDLVAPT